ncbi:MAG: hypothetical protein Q8L35_08775 [Actinomycetota bacterium]|nr:hypothetical protein [Actinomycetota bacterium]
MSADISGFVRNVRLVKLVLRVMDLPDKTIKFERQAGTAQGYRYPLAEEYLGANTQEQLEELADNSLMERQFVAKEFGCPKCGSVNLSLRLHCPNCDSTQVERQDIIEHVSCGFQGPQSKFVDNVCPKCSQPLGQVGVDYVRQGTQYVCRSCDQIFQAPIQKLTCMRDDISFSVSDAPEVSLYNYGLMPRLEEEINRAVNQQQYIQEKVEALGFKTRSPATMTGRSGVKQTFFLVATSGVGFMKTNIVMDIINTGSTEEVFSLYAKAIDVGAYGVLFAAIPSLSDDAKKVADSYGMTYVEAEDMSTTADRLVKKFAELVETPEERMLEVFGGLGKQGPPSQVA